MQINGNISVHGPHSLQGPHTQKANGAQAPRPAAGAPDQLDISPAAEAAAELAASGEIRSDLVNRVRDEIAAGTYETPDKLDAAIDRFLDEVG